MLILIIEDDLLIQDLYRTLFEINNINIIQVYDSKSAEEYYKENFNNVDLVITDLNLNNDGDGYDLIPKLIKINENIKILIVSAFISSKEQMSLLTEKYKCVILEKPFCLNELISLVKTYV